MQSETLSKPPQEPAQVREVTRHIPREISEVLWGRAAGRCQFRDCNCPLWKSPVTQEPVKLAERAHIYAFGGEGPRSEKGFRTAGLNGLENLLLVCRNCHKTIDQHKDGGRYSAGVLKAMKREHESRVELVTGIFPKLRSQLLFYSTSVGQHQLLPSFDSAAQAMFPARWPANDQPIELGHVDGVTRDSDEEFWETQAKVLRAQFDRRVSERLSSRIDRVEHLSVFGIAPQPLLMLLGSLLGDIASVRVHQLRREPQTWEWESESDKLDLQVTAPASPAGTPALVLAVSATVTEERITEVLGDDAAIWRVAVPTPSLDLMRAESQLAEWRVTLRGVFDQIKANHGQASLLHVFPAIPVSAAIEFGRVRMPKADMPFRIYDQVNARGGFVPTIDIE